MKKKSKKSSFRKKFFRLNAILIFVVVGFISLYYVLNQTTNNMYTKTVQMYDDLSEFYNSLQQSHNSLKSYLYTDNEADLDTYNTHIKATKDYAKKLENQTDSDFYWRFVLLNNMVETYQGAAQGTIDVRGNEQGEYLVYYNDFLKQYELINKTSSTYYEYLTTQMKMDRGNIADNERFVLTVSIIIALLAIGWIIFYSIRTVKSITDPIYSLLKNIKQIRNGDYDLSEISNTSSEMEVLCNALDDMAVDVKQNVVNEKEKSELKNRLLEKENESLKKDELLAQSELKLLQNQINPHFLFNTLNMIYKTSCSEDATLTSSMVSKTCDLLRYGLDKLNKTSNLYGEIDAIKNYIYIQELRFNKRINFELIIDDDLPNIQVPGLIVQPLVENAVKHGLQEVIDDGEVIIKFEYKDQHVLISVSDNGKGIDTDALEKILLNDFSEQEHRASLGLYNVLQRVKMFYGKKADVSFNSYPDCGFEAIIDIHLEVD